MKPPLEPAPKLRLPGLRFHDPRTSSPIVCTFRSAGSTRLSTCSRRRSSWFSTARRHRQDVRRAKPRRVPTPTAAAAGSSSSIPRTPTRTSSRGTGRPTRAGDAQVRARAWPASARSPRRRRERPEHPYVLIIDEINRGNIAKIFGELYFLLEYRDEAITLQYSAERAFRCRANLFVIGTMNTADRSIALVDAALRRRFYFVGFPPDGGADRATCWSKWLKRNELDPEPPLLRELNRRMAERSSRSARPTS